MITIPDLCSKVSTFWSKRSIKTRRIILGVVGLILFIL